MGVGVLLAQSHFRGFLSLVTFVLLACAYAFVFGFACIGVDRCQERLVGVCGVWGVGVMGFYVIV